MPFTLAHPAAALPLRRLLGPFGSPSALAVGSMIPDLAYFLPLGVSGAQSHSVRGLFWFCLPAGVLGCVAYRVVVRPFVLQLVPDAVARRVRPSNAMDWTQLALLPIGVSVLLAAATHVVWDSFTHSMGFVVQALPVLRQPVHVVDWYEPHVFTVLQHGSTLAGLSALAFWAFLWFRGATAREGMGASRLPRWARASIVVAVALPSVAAGVQVLRARFSAREWTFRVLQDDLGRAIFSAGTVFLMLFMLAALVWRAWQLGSRALGAAHEDGRAEEGLPAPGGGRGDEGAAELRVDGSRRGRRGRRWTGNPYP